MAIKTASGSGLSNSLSSGLVLLNTTTFSGVSSQSINGVFSATYKNYRVVVSDLIGSTTAQDLDLRLRKSATDNTSNIYHRQFTKTAGVTYTGGRILSTSFGIGSVISTGTNNMVYDIFSPNVATTKTGIIGIASFGATNDIIILQNVFTHDLAASADFDGFTLIVPGGTFSGSISVYAYNV